MSANPRVVAADTVFRWDGALQRLARGTVLDVAPGSALLAAIGPGNLVPLAAKAAPEPAPVTPAAEEEAPEPEAVTKRARKGNGGAEAAPDGAEAAAEDAGGGEGM